MSEGETACPCISLSWPWSTSPLLLLFRLITQTVWLICLQALACAEQFHMWSGWLLMEAFDRGWCIRLSGAGGEMKWTLITLPASWSRIQYCLDNRCHGSGISLPSHLGNGVVVFYRTTTAVQHVLFACPSQWTRVVESGLWGYRKSDTWAKTAVQSVILLVCIKQRKD